MTVLDRTHALGVEQGTPGRFIPELFRVQRGVAWRAYACWPQAWAGSPTWLAVGFCREAKASGRAMPGPGAKVTSMSLFRRRERPDTGPSYAEEESNPELLSAEKAVNQMPSVPMVGGVAGVILGHAVG